MTLELRPYLAIVMFWAFVGACGPPREPFPRPPSYLQTETVNGPVIGVDQRSIAEQMAQGLRVRIQPAGSPLVVVDLAPGWYLDQQGLHFSEQDRLTVEGSMAPGNGVFRAQRVTKGAVSVRLRDEQGRPYWDQTVVPSGE